MESLVAYFEKLAGFFGNKSAALIVLILLAPSFVASLFLVPAFIFKGVRKGALGALLLAGVSVGSCFAATGLAKLASLLIVALFDRSAGQRIENAFARFGVRIEYPALGHEHLSSFSSALLSAAVSVIAYFLLYILLLAVARALLGKLFRKEGIAPVSRTFGALIGAADALLVSLLLFAPLYTMIGSGMHTLHGVVDAFSAVYESLEGTGLYDERFGELKKKIDEAYEPVMNAPTVYLCSRSPLNFGRTFFGSFRYDGKALNAYDEIDSGISKVKSQMLKLGLPPESYGAEQFRRLREMLSESGEKTKEYSRGILDEVLSFLERFRPEPEKAPEPSG